MPLVNITSVTLCGGVAGIVIVVPRIHAQLVEGRKDVRAKKKLYDLCQGSKL